MTALTPLVYTTVLTLNEPAGMVTDAAVDDEFLAVWRVVQIITDLTVIAMAPEHRDAAGTHLEKVLRR